jgi:Zn-dependent protease
MLFSSPSIDQLVASTIALLVGLTFHEFSHALIADQLGDTGPRRMGRLTLNPVPHIDPIGALMLLVARFGWAKPVMVNPYALRNGRRGMAMVAAGGPVANVLVAIAFGVLFRVMSIVGLETGFVPSVVFLVVYINFILALFNLLPIPPLDGYNVALAFLPPGASATFQRYAPYGVIVLLLLVLLPNSPLRVLLGLAEPLARLVTGA